MKPFRRNSEEFDLEPEVEASEFSSAPESEEGPIDAQAEELAFADRRRSRTTAGNLAPKWKKSWKEVSRRCGSRATGAGF